MEYFGGEFRNYSIDPDMISWFELDELVTTNVGVKYDYTLYYLFLNCSTFEEALRRVNSDESVMKMANIGAKLRVVEVYIVREEDDDILLLEINKELKSLLCAINECERRKMTVKLA